MKYAKTNQFRITFRLSSASFDFDLALKICSFDQLNDAIEKSDQGKEPSKPSKLGPSFPLKLLKSGITLQQHLHE